MKQLYLILSLVFFVPPHLQAQVNSSLKPLSLSFEQNSLTPVPEIILPFDITEADRADTLDAKNGELPKFSRSVFTHITLDNSGSWTLLPNGDRIWRVRVTSKNAQGLLPYFDKFYLPSGAMLHVYRPDLKEIIGAFTSTSNPADGYYATGLIHGESCILEYYEPLEVVGQGAISLNEVGHAYRWVNDYFPLRDKTANDTLGFLHSSSCEVNVNCSEGSNYQDQKRAVVCMIVQSGTGQGICNATLVNNVRQDCTPLLLSAQHCSRGVSANQYSQFLFYFNYESPLCSTPTNIGSLGDYFISGCTKKADSNDNGGDTGSDFLLLQLNVQPPASYNAYYAGWDNRNIPSDSGVCIHHPNGDIKKISTYTIPVIDTTWWTVSGTHWLVQWATTLHGHGVTEIGSSGAPLFNKGGAIIGHLTGGDSYCTTPNNPDYFGKIAYDWTSNGTIASRQLKPWLDPDNTGTQLLNGRDADCVSSIGNAIAEIPFVTVAPNPSHGNFALRFRDSGQKKIRIFNELGELLLTETTMQQNLQLALDTLNSGLYFLTIESSSGKTTRKLIVNH